MTLLVKKNKTEYLEKEVFAEINPVGRDEFTAAGQKDYKASMMIEVWGFEYEGQTEVMVDGRKMAIYRTYGPKSNGKIEFLYAEKNAYPLVYRRYDDNESIIVAINPSSNAASCRISGLNIKEILYTNGDAADITCLLYTSPSPRDTR